MTEPAPAVTVIDLGKSYGEVEAVRGIEFEGARDLVRLARARLEAAVAGLIGMVLLGVAIWQFSCAE